MKIVILAGGYGTRISEESHLRPKPMIEIGEKPILWHIMKYYSHAGFTDFVICCGYRGYIIKEYFANYYLHRANVTFDFTSEGRGGMSIHSNLSEPWKVTLIDTGTNAQTGGRIKRIQSFIGDERFMLTYGDGIGDIDLHALVKQHDRSGKIMTMTAVQPVGRFGVMDISGEDVTAFREKAVDGASWINAGFMVAEPELFSYIDNDLTVLERAPMERLSKEGKLGVFKHYKSWYCMDTQRDKNALEHLWRTGKAPWKVWRD